MGKSKGPYNPEYPEGSRVRIISREMLEKFQLEWNGHNKLQDEQLAYGSQIADVQSIGFYHGGDELYKLKNVPGVWHEACLEQPMQYPCPCCGFLVFGGPPGTDDICPICFWQDDASSLRYATIADGPNRVSLVDAQRNFAEFGASELRRKSFVRKPMQTDRRDPSWRPIGPQDVLDTSQDAGCTPWPADMTKLYYWRDDYWLKSQ